MQNIENHLRPTVHDLLVKISALQELKQLFAQRGADTPKPAGLRRNFQEMSRLMKEGIDARYKHRSDGARQALHQLATTILAAEGEFPEAALAYHGSRSSALPDLFGAIATLLLIRPQGEIAALPRLRTSHFSTVGQFLRRRSEVYDHEASVRKQLLACSPALPSFLTSHSLENAFAFFVEGAKVDRTSFDQRIADLLDRWGLSAHLDSSFKHHLATLSSFDAQQTGYLHQYFWQRPETLADHAYPSASLGRPLARGTKHSSALEFLHAFKSLDTEERKQYERKYGVKLDQVRGS